MNAPPPRTRRRFLRSTGTGALAGVAGCLGSVGGTGGRSTTVAILAAGSLQHALSAGLEPAVDVPVTIETHGSATVARLIAGGQRDPDVVALADVALFEAPLSPAWYAEFASNALVIAANPDTAGGKRLLDAGPERWYEPLLDGRVSLGRTDPDQDPLGYRTRFMLALASRYYGVSNLEDRILHREQIYPETSLLSQFETGAIDAAVAYRNMAVERDYEYVALPDEINLSNPSYTAGWYETTAYTLPSGDEIRGGPISYAATIRHLNDASMSVFDVLTTGDYLDDYGFLLGEQFPTTSGDVPSRVSTLFDSASDDRSRLDRPHSPLSETVSDITVLL